MQHPLAGLARHGMSFSIALVLVVLPAVSSSLIVTVAEQVIVSTFVRWVLRILEYATVLGGAFLMLFHLVQSIWQILKRGIR